MSEIAKSIKSDYRVAVAYMKTDLASQAALTLSIVRHHVAYAALPVKFNMRSRRIYVQAFPEDFAEARLLHYNASEIFAKTSDIESLTAVKNWLTLHEQSTEPMTALIADGFRSVIHDVEDDWKAAREP
jgi:hypothetical protein